MLDTEINEDTATGHKTRCNNIDDAYGDDANGVDDNGEDYMMIDNFDAPALPTSSSEAGRGFVARQVIQNLD